MTPNYRAYMSSPRWRARRAARVARAGGRCEFVLPDGTRCPHTRSLHAHHNTYVRLGHEWDADIDIYCWYHHLLIHLWDRKCWRCHGPCLGDEREADLWLRVGLGVIEIDPANPPPLPRCPQKEYFFGQLPRACPRCAPPPGPDD